MRRWGVLGCVEGTRASDVPPNVLEHNRTAQCYKKTYNKLPGTGVRTRAHTDHASFTFHAPFTHTQVSEKERDTLAREWQRANLPAEDFALDAGDVEALVACVKCHAFRAGDQLVQSSANSR